MGLQIPMRDEEWSYRGEPMTLADFEAREPENRDELWRGRLVREPHPPGARHALVAGRVYRALLPHVSDGDALELLMDCGFQLQDEPGTVRMPDIALVRRERLPSEVPVGFLRVAPDLAVEIVSPSNRVSDMTLRVLDYLDAGTRMLWLIDPESRTATVYDAGGSVRLLRAGGTLSAGDVLPTFGARLEDLLV